MPDPGPPKLIVDSDWKSQAQAEKDRMAEAEQKKAEAAKARADAGSIAGQVGMGAGGGGPGGQQALPPADFRQLVGTLVTQCLMYMGAFPDPETGRAVVSLEYAKFHIDLLGVLADKVKNNITTEEQGELNQALSELRMQFVQLTKAVANMIKQQAAEAAAGGGMPGGPAGFAGAGGGMGGNPGLKFRPE